VQVIGIVQDNLPMYVFSIDIPFKGSQNLSNRRSKVTEVSYLHSGVNDRCACQSGVNDTIVQLNLSIIFANSKPYSKGFNLCIRDQGEVV
jgi:hypothetical protein